MLSPLLDGQGHLGPLIANRAGLRGVEALTVDAGCASGAMAVRQAYLAVASGAADVAVAVGVEKMKGSPTSIVTASLASASDARHEAAQGATFAALNALCMRRYQHEFGVDRREFAEFVVTAHANATTNPHATFRRAVSEDEYLASPPVADPLCLLDASPTADGAAAVVLAPVDYRLDRGGRAVRVRASAAATSCLAWHDRADPLWLDAVALSTERALQRARVTRADLDLCELHDAFTIMTALSIEAGGFAPRGRATWLARDGHLRLDGKLPISTCGGLKARGHPVGATGVYQIVEATRQLRGQAGVNQVRNARIALTQSIGGSGATVVTHILEGP